MKKATGHSQNVKYYLNSKRRAKNKYNYRTSTSSWSNHSYLNSSVMGSYNKGAAYTDIFIGRGHRENNQPLRDYPVREDSKVRILWIWSC